MIEKRPRDEDLLSSSWTLDEVAVVVAVDELHALELEIVEMVQKCEMERHIVTGPVIPDPAAIVVADFVNGVVVVVAVFGMEYIVVVLESQ